MFYLFSQASEQTVLVLYFIANFLHSQSLTVMFVPYSVFQLSKVQTPCSAYEDCKYQTNVNLLLLKYT